MLKDMGWRGDNVGVCRKSPSRAIDFFHEPNTAAAVTGHLWESDGTGDNTGVSEAPAYSNVGQNARPRPSRRETLHRRPRLVYDSEKPWIVDPSTPQVGTIAGTVFVDLDHDGVPDLRRAGVAKLSRLHRPQRRRHPVNKNETSVRATANGKYEFNALPFGTYRIVETDRAVPRPHHADRLYN